MKKRCVYLVAIIVCLLPGCALEPGESIFDDQEIGEIADNETTPPGEELGEGPGAGTMTGTWLKVHEASSCVLGQEQVTTAFYLVDIVEEGVGLRESRRLCRLDLSPLLGFRPVASRQVLESIEFVEVDLGMVSRLVVGGAYSSATEVGLWGVELDDALADDLPPNPTDEGVIDGDGDGNPGVSLQLEGSGCERYMGQRQVVRYFGDIVAPNEILGRSATRTHTIVYGASAPICQVAPTVEPNDEHSRFRMVRIDGLGGAVQADEDGDGLIDCQEAAVFFDVAWEAREPDGVLCS